MLGLRLVKKVLWAKVNLYNLMITLNPRIRIVLWYIVLDVESSVRYTGASIVPSTVNAPSSDLVEH